MKTVQTRRIPSLFLTSLVSGAVGLILFVGLLNREHTLIILSILILGIIVTTKVWSKFANTGIRHSLAIDRDKVFPGEKVTLVVSVENRKFLPVWLEIEAPLHGPLIPSPETETVTGHRSLLWYQKTRFQWEFAVLKRGVCTIGPLRVTSGDLFGFFQEEAETLDSLQLVVYPQIVPLAPFRFPRRDFFGIPGGQSPVDDPVYILGTSDYHHGRPAKFIHWKASARHQRLQEKVFDSSEQEKILFLVDMAGFSKANAGEEFERGIEVIASLVVQCDRRGCAVGILTNGVVTGVPHTVAIARSARQVSTILEMLARMELQPREVLLDTVKDAGMIPWGTTCLSLTLTEDGETDALREYLKRRRIPLVVLTGETISPLRGVAPEGSEGLNSSPVEIFPEEVRPI